MKETARIICGELGDMVSVSTSLCNHTSIKIGGRPLALITPKNEKELKIAVTKLEKLGIDYKVIGAGSNILFSENMPNTVLLSLDKLLGVKQNVKTLTLECMAGEKLSSCYRYSASIGLSGFEAIAGIPGTIGGAVIMNAGAFGVEIKDILESVRVMYPSGRIKTIKAKDLGLSYRNSKIKNSGLIIVSAVFKLKVLAPSVIRSMALEYAKLRAESQPVGLSLGSVFKKHGNTSAGELIEKVGLKGAVVGGCKISEKHANFIINTGNGTSRDYKKLVELARKKVKKQFNIDLVREVEYIDDKLVIKNKS